MKAWIRSVSKLLLWSMGAAGAAGACSDDAPPPESSSATHFLQLCADTCPDGLECICGVCTKACTANAVCSAGLAGQGVAGLSAKNSNRWNAASAMAVSTNSAQ